MIRPFDLSRARPCPLPDVCPNSRAGSLAFRALMLLALTCGVVVGMAPAPARAAPPTVVSLTFDDGNADQMTAVPVLQQHGMHGTFYVISGSVGAPNYVTRANLATIAQAGNEIGGHTVSHPDLTTVPLDEARRQVCNDRVTLSGWGYTPTSFAYPYAAYNSTIEGVVADCGYNSARALGDLASAHGCTGCGQAGPIPPPDPYALEALDEIDSTWTLAQMQSAVTAAERSGGWVPFTFHHICGGCDSLSISPSIFSSFVTWLASRPSSTTVKTVNQVVGGTVKPVVSGPPASGGLAVANPSLETLGGSGFPQCWFPGGYGTNTVTWTRSSDARSGSFSERLDMSGYSSGDAKLLPVLDLGGCSPSVAAGSTYTVSAYYKATRATQFALYYRDASGAWYYWTSSPWFASASAWTQASWTTPAVPAGASGVSFGLSLFGNGSLTTDDYAIGPAGAAAGSGTAPVAPQGLAPASGYRPGSHPHHRTWSRTSRAFLPAGPGVRPHQRVAVPFLPD
jgi:peptidoglycan/xylan/chitin deacetylase (PgdA/CDA1 family)